MLLILVLTPVILALNPVPTPKSNNLNQNKINNNLKKSGIGVGIVIILLWVYFAICHNLENKIKNKIITKSHDSLERKSKELKLLSVAENKDENKDENKTRLDSFFEKLCHYDIFALRRLNNLINEDNFRNNVLFIIYSIKSYCSKESDRKKNIKITSV